jgi:DNA invertase Pin-like site-specific DNA recombinase
MKKATGLGELKPEGTASPEKPKRFILYLRCSTEEQRSDLQKDDLVEYAKKRSWHYEILEDKATGTTSSRPMLKKLMHMARSRQIDGLAVWRCDRLFRSLKEAVLTLSELTELGVEFYSHKDGIDLTTSQGRLLANLLMSFAEFESELIRSRVRAGLMAAKARGVRLGRPRTVTPEFVKKILELREKGHSVRVIEKMIGKAVSHTSIGRIIKEAKNRL